MSTSLLLIAVLISFATVCKTQTNICQCSQFDVCINNLQLEKQASAATCLNTAQSASGVNQEVVQCYQLYMIQRDVYHNAVKACVDLTNGPPCVGLRQVVANGLNIPNFPVVPTDGRRRKRDRGGGSGGLTRLATASGITVSAQLSNFESSLKTCVRSSSVGGRRQCATNCTLQRPTTYDRSAYTTCANQQGTNPIQSLCTCLAAADPNLGTLALCCKALLFCLYCTLYISAYFAVLMMLNVQRLQPLFNSFLEGMEEEEVVEEEMVEDEMVEERLEIREDSKKNG